MSHLFAELVEKSLEADLAIDGFVRRRIVGLQGRVQVSLHSADTTACARAVAVHNEAPMQCHGQARAFPAPAHQELCNRLFVRGGVWSLRT